MLERQNNFSSVREVSVDTESHGQRIDNYLSAYLKGVPRSHIYRLLRRGEVRVNSRRIAPAYRLQLGDLIRVPPVRVAETEAPIPPQNRVLEVLRGAILYEDRRLLVLNKPAGMAVHGGSGLSWGVIEAMRALRPEEQHLELVHRLDRETSGCLLISKRNSSLRQLHELIRTGRIEKRYLALLAGRLAQNWLEVDAPLQRNILRGGERLVSLDPIQGKAALTQFRRLNLFADSTLVEARLITGRTHQIRVHAASLGHPVLGDEKYGDERANARMREQGLRRLFLHAESLSFRWPGEDAEFSARAPLDPVLVGLLPRLGRSG